ncbi:MAG: hypothetical protein MRY83_16125 [Flavobacteriales bacterium]|nr:hypothetical protein [Flavobacteriales bacterium]
MRLPILIIFFIYFMGNVFSQNDEKTIIKEKWILPHFVWLDTNHTDIVLRNAGKQIYGHILSFTGDAFQSVYSAPCGNDCFRDAYGRFRFEDEKLVLQLEFYDEGGYCAKGSDIDKRHTLDQTFVYTYSFGPDQTLLLKREGAE